MKTVRGNKTRKEGGGEETREAIERGVEKIASPTRMEKTNKNNSL